MRPRVSTSTNIFCVSLYKFELQISTSTYATIFTWDYVIDVYNFIDGNIFVVELMEV